MKPFTHLSATAAPLLIDNVDTDQLLPARFLSARRDERYGSYCLHDLRFEGDGAPASDFILNDPAYPTTQILIAGSNFGCGSSREGAVHALIDLGIRVVIAVSFGEIFRQNALINGLLVIALHRGAIESLCSTCKASEDKMIEVDLVAQSISTAGMGPIDFEIDPFRKTCLLHGMDEISFTEQYTSEIEAFERGFEHVLRPVT